MKFATDVPASPSVTVTSSTTRLSSSRIVPIAWPSADDGVDGPASG